MLVKTRFCRNTRKLDKKSKGLGPFEPSAKAAHHTTSIPRNSCVLARLYRPTGDIKRDESSIAPFELSFTSVQSLITLASTVLTSRLFASSD